MQTKRDRAYLTLDTMNHGRIDGDRICGGIRKSKCKRPNAIHNTIVEFDAIEMAADAMRRNVMECDLQISKLSSS